MDEGTTRHGIPTLNKTFGNSQAILVGDMIFASAYEYFIGAIEKNPDIKKELFDMAREVVVGQMIDIDLSERTKFKDKEILEKNRLKTAFYSFVRPVRIGLKIAKADEKNVKAFSKLSEALGMIYQNQDDILDIVGDPKLLGKTQNDADKNQKTLINTKNIDLIQKKIFKEITEIESAIQKMKISEEPKKLWLELISILKNRKK
jgi:geranylgeranyl pyrophosphate synthase